MTLSNSLAHRVLVRLAEHLNVTEADLKKRRGTGSMLLLRGQAAWAMKQLGLSWSEVGILFGERHLGSARAMHATVEAQRADPKAVVYKQETDALLEFARAAVEELRIVDTSDEALRERLAAADAEIAQVVQELDRHGAPPGGSLHGRIRAMVAVHVKEVETLRARANMAADDVKGSLFRKLPTERDSVTRKIAIGTEHDLYITVGLYEDGTPGEVFMKMSKQGTMLSGLMDACAISLSLCLKHGVPVEKIVRKLSHLRFEPSGFTGAADIPHVESPVDALAKFLAARFLKKDEEKVGEPPSTT